jgi:DNA-binding winged helix-turn-helix (wHTH) protein
MFRGLCVLCGEKVLKNLMGISNDDLPVLVAQRGPLKGQRFPLDKPLVVGRDPSCEIVVPERQVSRYHARIMPNPEGIVLEDLGSKNGTHTNGEQVKNPIVLQDGDVIQIALAQEFMFLSSDATAPLDVGSARQGRLMLDKRSRRVWVNQQQIVPALSASQFQLLWALSERPGEVLTRQELVQAVWGEDQFSGISDQALDALIRRLRDRLAAIDPSIPYIVTVRGHGVRLDNPSE